MTQVAKLMIALISSSWTGMILLLYLSLISFSNEKQRVSFWMEGWVSNNTHPKKCFSCLFLSPSWTAFYTCLPFKFIITLSLLAYQRLWSGQKDEEGRQERQKKRISMWFPFLVLPSFLLRREKRKMWTQKESHEGSCVFNVKIIIFVEDKSLFCFCSFSLFFLTFRQRRQKSLDDNSLCHSFL